MLPPDPPVPATRRAIPRPPHHRPGRAASWGHTPPEHRRRITLDRVRRAVTAEPAGRLPAGATAERWLGLLGERVGGRPAAVLVPLFEEGGEARVVLTVRSDRLRSHQGEVAFPGGRLETGEGAVDGALREASEEVDLDPGSATVIGELSPAATVSSNSVITPVVATLEERPLLVASPDEVERVFDVALAELAADGSFHEEWWAVPGRRGAGGVGGDEFAVWFFEVAGETIWGATARILVELTCLVLRVEVPSIHRPR